MNTSPSAGGAPPWLRELVDARTHYEEMFGWPVAIEIEQQVVAAPTGGVLDAVTMPATLGRRVLADLQLMMLEAPVVAAPDDTSWMFLTQPVAEPGRDVPADLRRLQVHRIPAGTHVLIPTRLDSASGLRWVTRPQPRRPSPPWSVVIGATRRVAATRAGAEPVASPASAATEERALLVS